MSFLRVFPSLAAIAALALLSGAPAAALSTASAELVLTLTFQGAFFTGTSDGAIPGDDYEMDELFNDVDNTPQLNTGTGSAASTGSVTVNGTDLDSFMMPLSEGDVIVWTTTADVSADGAGSSFSEFYENLSTASATILASDDMTGAPRSLTFVFDWAVSFDTTLQDDALVGQAIAFTSGDAADDFASFPHYFDFGFGDVADGVPSTPSGLDSGQLQLSNPEGVDFIEFSFQNSVFVNATVDVIPEPATSLMLGLGLAGLALRGSPRERRGLRR